MVISRLEQEAEVTRTQNEKAADARIKLAVLSSSLILLSKLKLSVPQSNVVLCVCESK